MSKLEVNKKKLKCSKNCVISHSNDPRLDKKKVMQLKLPAFASEFKLRNYVPEIVQRTKIITVPVTDSVTWPPDFTKPPPPLAYVSWPPNFSQPPPPIESQLYSPASPVSASPVSSSPVNKTIELSNEEIIAIVDDLLAEIDQISGNTQEETKQKKRKQKETKKIKKLKSEISDLVKF